MKKKYMMVFACQENSFLREYKTTVKSCIKSELKRVVNGKKTSLSGYDVILEDTILFPEGGGQPCDYGHLAFMKDGHRCEIPVLQVTRKGNDAVHFVETSVDEGQVVDQILNWERRLDHMQQHSGQHLITAIADKQFGCGTVSWWLGESVSHIELDTPELSNDKVAHLEKLVNAYIYAGTPVVVNVFTDNDPQLSEVRTRGLPGDHKGAVRVISIEGVDNNMCCGTHVSNLCQLQGIKLLGVEKGKKGHCLLQFLAGGRLMKHLADMLEREQALTVLLNNGPAVHAELVSKLQKYLKISNKNMQSVLKDLAVLEAAQLKQLQPKPAYFALHRKEGDSDFMNTFIREVNDQDVLLFLTVGEEKGPANMVLFGKPGLVELLGPMLCDLLEGKGAGKGTKFQAKVKSLTNRDKAVQLIKDHFSETE